METATKDQPNIQTSSDEIAIRVSGLSKRYLIGGEKKGSLTETLAEMIGAKNNRKEEFWALKDINFEVKKGEMIGIIGKNGAGKSTLLKILSRITQPTSGKVEINGRVASLLEVGTGFHPELTGRENIYLNGTILGMSRQEVKDKFEEIVEFSGVRKFIDTPVKHYSSGMYVRLAFAVAAHLDPEILIIDEVLAVGDADFQKKCLGKMKEVAGEGRTVLFVSHNMAAVKTLCEHSILLANGVLVNSGKTDKVIAKYLHGDKEQNSNLGFRLSETIDLNKIEITNAADPNDEITINDPFVISFNCLVKEELDDNYSITMRIKDVEGNYLFASGSEFLNNEIPSKAQLLKCSIPGNLLNSNKYLIDVLLVKNRKELINMVTDVQSFVIIDQEAKLGEWMGRSVGFFKPKLTWSVQKEEK